MMAAIRSKDTKPEVRLRKALHALGFRYRLHVRDMPGTPDMFLRSHNAAIFFNGCFWHGHCCALFRLPGTRREFWEAKISRNRARDAIVREELDGIGCRHLTVWECALRGPGRLGYDEAVRRIAEWIPTSAPSCEIRSPDQSPAQ